MVTARLTVLLTVALVLPACSEGGGESQRTTSTTVESATERTDLPGWPSAVAVGAGSVWVADDGRDVIVRLDEETGEIEGEPISVGPEPVALDHDGTQLFVAHATGRITIVTEAGVIGAPLELGGALSDVVAGDGAVWVADIEGSAVHRIDVDRRAVDRRISVPQGAVRLALASDRLWVSNLEATVTAVDLASGAVSEPVPVGVAPIGIAVTSTALWVANSEDDTVTRLHPSRSGPIGAPIAVGSAPIAVIADGDRIWVVNQDGESVTVLDGRRGASSGEAVDVGLRPRGAAVSRRGLWIVGVEPSGVVLVRRP